MAKVDVTRTELVWPGKYNDDGTLKEVPRVSLPFQVIETVNESRATREARKRTGMPLFDEYEGTEGDSFEEGWRNKLIWGDNLLVMSSLLKRFAGKIDLIYIDPPFATGADFSFSAPIGESGRSTEKQASAIEENAYRDTWWAGTSSYLQMMYDRIRLARDILCSTGSIFVHCDYRLSHLLAQLMDDIFGLGDKGTNNSRGFRNEIVWLYGLGGSSPRCYPKKHDMLLWYSKSDQWYFEPPMVPAKSQRMKGKEKKCPDYWDVPSINNMADERTGYPTQKPEDLLTRILNAHSRKNDLVADFFCGSGTTLAVAEKLGRRWIGCDLGRWGVHVTRKRLLGIERCKPFEVLNLGKYERQYWSQNTFGDRKQEERAYFEYLAFILRLYSARPVPGMIHLHGRKNRAMVHVGAVDAPVTISEIQSSVQECLEINQLELHVLGWEWEMGLQDLMVDEARKQGVSLRLLQIPREVMEQQATDKGDVTFFELAYLEAHVERLSDQSSRHIRIGLTDFVIPPNLIPEQVRNKIGRWSDYIDYWAIDWDFREDTFIQGWVAYRTRKDRSLPLTSDVHEYYSPGSKNVVVKVIDIFGNDTSQVVNVEIR